MSSFGSIFRVTTFGESHCRGVGVVIDGVPPQMKLKEGDVQPQLTRRRPGQSRITTPRQEKDIVTILSGTEMGRTLGTPIAMLVANTNVRPDDYKEMSAIPRPGHADYTYQAKYGTKAASGGGRSSARETIGRVAAGAVGEKWLKEKFGTEISAWVSSVADIHLPKEFERHFFTREEVDRLGRLRVLRDPKHWHRVDGSKPANMGSSVQANGASNDSGIHAKGAASAADTTSKGGGQVKADDVDAFSTPLGTSTKSSKAGIETQRSVDSASERAFVEDVRAGRGRELPAYIDSTGRVLTYEGKVYKGTVDLPAWTTDELIPVRCPHAETAARIATLIRDVRHAKDSIGGVVTGAARRVPVGLGEPAFDKLEAKLAHGMLSLPATKGFEIGSGFAGTHLRGSQHNDAFQSHPTEKSLLMPVTNLAGGTLGGISSGADIFFRVAVKPVSSIGQPQATVNFNGEETVLEAKGRHDPCVLPRTPPLIEAMTSLVLADAAMIQLARIGSVAGPKMHIEARSFYGDEDEGKNSVEGTESKKALEPPAKRQRHQ